MNEQTEKLNGLFFLIVIGIVGYFFLFYGKEVKPIDPDDAGTIPKPTRFLETVQPILAVSIKPKDAAQLSAFYQALSKRVAADTAGKINNLETLIRVHATAGVVRFQDEDVFLSYEQLRQPVDDVIAAGAGVKRDTDGSYQQVEITASKRASVAEALMAAAWACERHSKKKAKE
ncbi:MAG: hypothetical protein LBT46_04850 [Planctomycetaceae bacterium]|jgi:hypothetical protein|nr:hypothetical protein [Planctomycetaceae bacterium]